MKLSKELRKENTNIKIATDAAKSTTNTPVDGLPCGRVIHHEQGGRTIEENGNRYLFDSLQVCQTKILEKFAFEGPHG